MPLMSDQGIILHYISRRARRVLGYGGEDVIRVGPRGRPIPLICPRIELTTQTDSWLAHKLKQDAGLLITVGFSCH